MPNRDYAARKKTKSSVNKWLILIIVFLILAFAALGLWSLSNTAPSSPTPNLPTNRATPKQTLPTPPEEVYSYIRDLETREVPVDKSSKIVQLTKQQEQLLKRQQEEEQRKQELLTQQQTTAENTAVTMPALETATPAPAISATEPAKAAMTAQEQAAAKEKEQKLAEEKRKQAELKKQQAQKPIGKFGLQCGAFKNKAQAENMQARLAMAGYNARISINGEWHRVVVGPIGDRNAASSAQSNAKSVAECLIVGM